LQFIGRGMFLRSVPLVKENTQWTSVRRDLESCGGDGLHFSRGILNFSLWNGRLPDITGTGLPLRVQDCRPL
jgi:hypothetical protein